MAPRTGSVDREVTGMTRKGNIKTGNNDVIEEERETNVDLRLQSGRKSGGASTCLWRCT